MKSFLGNSNGRQPLSQANTLENMEGPTFLRMCFSKKKYLLVFLLPLLPLENISLSHGTKNENTRAVCLDNVPLSSFVFIVPYEAYQLTKIKSKYRKDFR
jgi:hypothetical protein